MLKPGVQTVWPTPTKVGVLKVDKRTWYVGDKAFVWLRNCAIFGIDGLFDGWTGGEIKSLYDDGRVELDTGHVMLTASAGDLASIEGIRKRAHQDFPVSSRVILRHGADPKLGMEGFVISVQDAEKHSVPGIRVLAPEGYVPVMLDAGYAGAWMPHVLGLVAGPEATTVPVIGLEPKNNDGRDTCFWCGAPTKEIELAMSSGHVCTVCGR